MAEYLKHGGYDHYLRRLRAALATQRDQMLSSITEYFPVGTRATRPEGGYFLWVELPARVDSLKLHRLAREHRICIAPGPIFSAQGGFANFVRLNYGQPWSARLDHAMRTLGGMARSFL
jgi:DNA-binding transcriptional MocR family regulator